MKFMFQVQFTGVRIDPKNPKKGELVKRTFSCSANEAQGAIEKARGRVKDAKFLQGLIRPTYRTKCISEELVVGKGEKASPPSNGDIERSLAALIRTGPVVNTLRMSTAAQEARVRRPNAPPRFHIRRGGNPSAT